MTDTLEIIIGWLRGSRIRKPKSPQCLRNFYLWRRRLRAEREFRKKGHYGICPHCGKPVLEYRAFCWRGAWCHEPLHEHCYPFYRGPMYCHV